MKGKGKPDSKASDGERMDQAVGASSNFRRGDLLPSKEMLNMIKTTKMEEFRKLKKETSEEDKEKL